MYDELVKRLRSLSGTDNIAEFDEAADAIEELSKPRWIPVTERLPDGIALAVNALQGSYGYQEYLIGYISANEESDSGYSCENDAEILMNVTHWMPLPTPPKARRRGRQTMTELKPCPFCGSAVIIRYREANDDYIPECSNGDCIASFVIGNSFQTSDEATEVWNRRVYNG